MRWIWLLVLLLLPGLARADELRVYEGSAIATRWVEGEGWVRDRESDYGFTLVQQRAEGLWTSSKELRFARETLVHTERIEIRDAEGPGRELEVSTTLGEGSGLADAKLGTTRFAVRGERSARLSFSRTYSDDGDLLVSELRVSRVVPGRADVPHRRYVEQARLRPEQSPSLDTLRLQLRPGDPPTRVSGVYVEFCRVLPGETLEASVRRWRADLTACSRASTDAGGLATFPHPLWGEPLVPGGHYILRVHGPQGSSFHRTLILGEQPWTEVADLVARPGGPADLLNSARDLSRDVGQTKAIGGPGEAAQDTHLRGEPPPSRPELPVRRKLPNR